MKVVKIKDEIINCEEIRNISVSPNKNIYIYFKNSKQNCGDILIPYSTKEEKENILKLFYDEMTSKD